MGAFEDIRRLAKDEIPLDVTTVLLGECTHGTNEFYTMRAEITKVLVELRGFQVIIVEADWPFMWHVNEYVHRRKQKMYPSDVRFPDWMWINKPWMQLMEWLRQRVSDDKRLDVWVLGIDCYSKDESKKKVQEFFHNYNLKDFAGEFASSFNPDDPQKWNRLLSRLQWMEDSSIRSEISDRFCAEQNLECIISAHEYYLAQREDPAGSQADWNCRDQHMAATVMRLRENGNRLFGTENLKVIVWAHNSHVGDTMATPRGGSDFKRNETWNLGQMLRQNIDSTFIVGFYGYSGTVRATRKWGEPSQSFAMNCALPHSFSDRMHRRYPRGRCFVKGSGKSQEHGPLCDNQLDQMYICLHEDVHVTKGFELQSAPVVLESKEFIAVERRVHVSSAGDISRLKSDSGLWFTETTDYGAVKHHCLPKGYLNDLELMSDEQLVCQPLLQRWIGVQYCPDTEFRSHYGEMILGSAYDLIIFQDEVNTLDINLELTIPKRSADTSVPLSGTNKRLIKECNSIMKSPIENIYVSPLDDNIYEWHFVIKANQDPYTGGLYHGILEFPVTFPMSPPAIKMLTPSGRFELNTRICTTMSDFHSEMWNPSWTVEKILIGLMSFFYDETPEAIGSIKASVEERRRHACSSEAFNMKNEIYRNVLDPLVKGFGLTMVPDTDEVGDICRFCLVKGDLDLVQPCDCKGSSQYVHVDCLRQWQRSVLLTQSTHPKYQNRIDEICNVCESRFKKEFQPKSRHAVVRQYTGEELVARIVQGAIVVPSRKHSDETEESMVKVPQLREDLLHWAQGVYLLINQPVYERGSDEEHGEGVMAINLSRPVQCPPNSSHRLPYHPRGARSSPAETWRLGKWGKAPDVQFEHYIGGPCEPQEPIALCELSIGVTVPKQLAKNVITYPSVQLYVGEIDTAVMLAKLYRDDTDTGERTVKVFWGYAAWSNTQFLAELARQFWGISVGREVRFSNWPAWEEMLEDSLVAAESEYTNTNK
eukprot:GHVH01010786.1.p1 GENE.GHVH01010786.1~~GHVH01010786.1.p1  ORF type:complete len:989 (+),score=129.44 GHVH01010786.1:251-3217(+)